MKEMKRQGAEWEKILFTREMQIKVQIKVKYYYTPNRVARSKNIDNRSIGNWSYHILLVGM